jgi:hypothetical protein
MVMSPWIPIAAGAGALALIAIVLSRDAAAAGARRQTLQGTLGPDGQFVGPPQPGSDNTAAIAAALAQAAPGVAAAIPGIIKSARGPQDQPAPPGDDFVGPPQPFQPVMRDM